MGMARTNINVLAAASLLLAGCAVPAEKQRQQQAIDADIDEILSLPVPSRLGEKQRCLLEHDVVGFRGLDQHHLLFEGRNGRLWINTLTQRCSGLGAAQSVVMMPSAGSRVCRHDKIRTGGSHRGSAKTCRLGTFQPVTEEQVAEISAALQRR